MSVLYPLFFICRLILTTAFQLFDYFLDIRIIRIYQFQNETPGDIERHIYALVIELFILVLVDYDAALVVEITHPIIQIVLILTFYNSTVADHA